MSDDEIYSGIQAVARQHLGYRGTLRPDSRLVEELELDSLRLLTLVVELENHFRIRLEDGDEAGIETAADLVAIVRRRHAT